MKLSRCSGSKPQGCEDRIGGGALRFANDPGLYPGQTFGRLMNVIAVEIADGVKQLVDAAIPVACRRGWRRGDTAPRHNANHMRSIALPHALAFPYRALATTAGANVTARIRNQPIAG
jgi:hypothetical protein